MWMRSALPLPERQESRAQRVLEVQPERQLSEASLKEQQVRPLSVVLSASQFPMVEKS
jgi:hypothetical protein